MEAAQCHNLEHFNLNLQSDAQDLVIWFIKKKFRKIINLITENDWCSTLCIAEVSDLNSYLNYLIMLQHGYLCISGIVDVTISCLSSGTWEKINITCIPDDDRNLPVKLTGKEWGQQPEHPGGNSEDDGVGTLGIISIGIFCSLIIIVLSVLGILLVRK
jgi:hypothetical protein